MPRILFPHLASLLLLIGLLVPPCASAAQRPNVLVIYSDDQRADTIAALGNRHIRTPTLDELVRGGTTFTRAYCMGSMHGAVCIPSRAMLMTGRSLFRIKENMQGQETWPEAFARAGYATFVTGKWHNGEPSVKRAFQQGRAVFIGGMGWPYELPVRDLVGSELVNGRMSVEHSVKVFADAARGFISDRAPDKEKQPWLCYVAFNLPHDPRVCPDEIRRRYKNSRMPLPKNFLPQHPIQIGDLVVRDELLERWPRTPDAVKRHLADYYASIEYVDAQVGRILEALDATGQRENTLIVFAGDSGLAIGSHGLFGKQSIYEHSMRVPLIFAGPGVPKNVRREAFAYLLDVYPTLGALAGVSAPDGSEGANLSGVMTGSTSGVRDEVFLAYSKTQRSLRDERWKLMRFPQIGVSYLFDLQSDPEETRNLALMPEQRERVATMMAKLEGAQKKWSDSLPLTATNLQPAEFVPPQGEEMERRIRNNKTR